jgi:hypothetical protein
MDDSYPSAGPRSFSERLVGAMRLDASVYGEVEHDESALGQAIAVVALGAVAAGIGTAGEGSGGIIAGMVGSVVGWLVSAGFVWFIGVQWMDHTSDYPELLRTLGFASAPQLALVLAVVPVLGYFVAIAVLVWGLAAYVIAVREALDVSTERAVVVCVIAFGAKILTIVILVALLGILF